MSKKSKIKLNPETMIPPNFNATMLTIDQFRQMDYLAVEKCGLPIELMMENAGFTHRI